MCFTINVHLTRKAIEKRFSADTSVLHDFEFNYFYNAFSNPVLPVIAQGKNSEVQLMEWGLIPEWAQDRKKAEQIRTGTYNARSESLSEKPSFRKPLRSKRCLVIANGFFEWQLVQGVKIPWYITLKKEEPFVFAGLFDLWKDPDREDPILTFSIITTRANPLMEKIHNTKKRMPVILAKEIENEWIQEDLSLHRVNKLLLPLDESLLNAYTVSTVLSKASEDPGNPELITPKDHLVSGTLF